MNSALVATLNNSYGRGRFSVIIVPVFDWRGPSQFLWRWAFGGELDCVLGGGDGGQCGGESELSTHLGSIPNGGVRLQPSQPPWQELAGRWSGCRTPYPQY